MAEARILISIAAQDQFSNQFGSLNRSLYYTSSTLGILSGRLNEIAAPFEKFVSLIVKGTAAVGGLSAAMAFFSSKVAADFETRIAEIGTLLKGTADEAIPGLTEKILELGTELPKTIFDLGEAFYFVQSAMPGNTENLAVLETAARGATLGLTDTLTVADALTTVMNSFGQATADEATVALEKMFGAVIEGKITMETLATNIGSVSAAAANANLEMEDLFGAFALATRITGQASRSATGLRAALLALAKPSHSAQKAFDSYGISIRNTDGSIRNLIDVLGDVTDKQLSYNQIAELFPRARTINTIVALTSHYDELKTAIDVVGSSSEITLEALDEIMSTLNSKLEITSNLSDILAQSLGTKLNENLKGLVNSFNELLKVIIEYEKETESGADVLDTIFGDAIRSVSKALDVLAENFEDIMDEVDFSELSDQFNELKDAFGGLFDSDLSTAEGWVNLIQFLVDGVTLLTGVVTGFVETLQPTVNVMLELAEVTSKAGGGFGELLGKVAGVSIPFTTLLHLLSGIAKVVSLLVLPFMLIGLAATFPALGAGVAVAVVELQMFLATLGLISLAVVKIGAVITATYLLSKGIQAVAMEFEFVRDKVDSFKKGMDRLIVTYKDMERQKKTIEEVNEKYGTQVETIEEATDVIRKHSKAYKESTEQSLEVTRATKTSSKATKKFGDDLLTLDQVLAKVTDHFDDLNKAQENLAKLFSALSENISGLGSSDVLSKITELKKEIIALGGSFADIKIAEITPSVEGFDEFKKKIDELKMGLDLQLISLEEFVNLVDSMGTKVAEKYGVSADIVNRFTVALQHQAAEAVKSKEANDLLAVSLLQFNSVADYESAIKSLTPALQRMSGVMGATAGQAALKFAENIRRLAKEMGDTETAGKTLEQIVKENLGSAFDFGIQSTVDYMKAINMARHALGVFRQHLSEINDPIGLVRQALNDSDTVLLSLSNDLIDGKISVEDLNTALSALGPVGAIVQNAFSGLKDEDVVESMVNLRNSIAALPNIARDSNTAIDETDENLENAADSGNLLKTALDEVKKSVDVQVKSFGSLTTAAGKSTTAIEGTIKSSKDLHTQLAKKMQLHIDSSGAKESLGSFKGDFIETKDFIESTPIIVTIQERTVEAP